MNPPRAPRQSNPDPLPGINPSDPTPLHAQVERELRRMILLPEFQNGALFPNEVTLANRFGVSRGTARVALTRLMDQRLLERKPGVGTRVLPSHGESSIGAWRSFSREMARRGVTIKCFLVEARRFPAPLPVAKALQIAEGTEILRLDRVRGWDEKPVLHSRSWLHPRLGSIESADFSRPLYELIEQMTGAVAESAHEEFSAICATPTLARRLDAAAGEPLLLRRHTVYDTGKRPMEFAEIHYVSSRFSLSMELRNDPGR